MHARRIHLTRSTSAAAECAFRRFGEVAIVGLMPSARSARLRQVSGLACPVALAHHATAPAGDQPHAPDIHRWRPTGTATVHSPSRLYVLRY